MPYLARRASEYRLTLGEEGRKAECNPALSCFTGSCTCADLYPSSPSSPVRHQVWQGRRLVRQALPILLGDVRQKDSPKHRECQGHALIGCPLIGRRSASYMQAARSAQIRHPLPVWLLCAPRRMQPTDRPTDHRPQVQNSGSSGLEQYPNMAFTEAAACTMGDCSTGNSQQMLSADMSLFFNLDLKGLSTNYTAVVSARMAG